MKTAWEHVLKAARNLHQEGHPTLTRRQLRDEAVRLGWSGDPSTIETHVTAHMRDDREHAPHPYLEYVARNTYRLNDAGWRAAEGL
ncbi:hypothetical protein F8S09_15475 [Deinococcus sp. SDU3-2]|uniref:HTH HARE-type domain-containing protein n=1 Tax=Deinococcus terrestris TaxID=2651870 RepID=A0A7X1NYB9_9DEIO|nr:hypothetical protein [Deinococcus terrestris]MPY68056.1 hypothetical protein [Deinococcus terrestris]